MRLEFIQLYICIVLIIQENMNQHFWFKEKHTLILKENMIILQVEQLVSRIAMQYFHIC